MRSMSPLEDLDDVFFLLGRTIAVAEQISGQALYDLMLKRPRFTFHTMFNLLETNCEHELWGEGHALLAYINTALEELLQREADWNYLVWYLGREGRVLYRLGYDYQYRTKK